MSPFVIGLTGSIGCGKSHIRETLEELGAEGVDADLVAHEVMAPGGAAYERVLDAFGRDLLTAEGLIDRRKLGGRVFSDPEALVRLEQIVHPAVADAIGERVAASTAPAVVIEAIKLIEAGISAILCDEVWVATCSEEEQLARLHATRGMSAEEVRRRRLNQMPEAQMIAAAHRVVPTDGSLVETEVLVLRAWLELGLPLPGASVVTAEPNRLLIRIDEGAAVAEGFYRRLGFRRRRGRVFGLRL